MRLRHISLNNLRRRKAKVLFVFLGLTIAVATAVLLISIATSAKGSLESQLDQYGANLIVSPKSDALNLSYGGVTIPGVSYEVKELTDQDVGKIKTIKNKDSLAIVSPKLIGGAEANGMKTLVVGVNFAEELRLKRWWKLNGSKPANANQVIVGSDVARKMNVKAGSSVMINGKDFAVSAVLSKTAGSEDGVIFADLPATQALLGRPGAISMVEAAALCSTCPIEKIEQQISAKLPQANVSAIKQAVETKMQSLSQFTTFSYFLSVIVALIGALIVFITMTASVNERTREIGVFRALGFRQTHVIRIILLEALIISMLGGVAGYAIGITGSYLAAPKVTGMAVPFNVNPMLFAVSFALSVIIGLAASLYPAVMASRMDPSQALRTI